MVLQDTDLKNPEKTRQGKASKRREDQREDKVSKSRHFQPTPVQTIDKTINTVNRCEE